VVPVELYQNDGSAGAAIGAGIGSGIFSSAKEAFRDVKPITCVEPGSGNVYENSYQQWKSLLDKKLSAK
jgi:xylulokinase